MVAWLIHTLQTLIGDYFSFSALTYANLEKILNNNQVIRIVFYKKKKDGSNESSFLTSYWVRESNPYCKIENLEY